MSTIYSLDFLELIFRLDDFNPFPKQQILDSSKPKESSDDNFKFAEISITG